MNEPAHIAGPIAQDVLAALEILRKLSEPFDQPALQSQANLIKLPFLRGLATPGAQAARLRLALEFLVDDLARDQRVVYRHVFQKVGGRGLGERQRAAADEINNGRPREQKEATEASV
ncbi:MAG: hypothetical protein ABR992_06020, partial [Solirubrobacteraceae bacterium]